MNYAKDADLGQQVRQHLIDKGVETPFTPRPINRDRLQELFTEIHKEIGMDLEDDSIIETPRRLAKLYSHEEFFTGLDYDRFPKATVVENKMKFDEMVLERNVKVNSLCEHHWLPITGIAMIAYLPAKKVMGLSKLNRIVDFFCRRPQIQERLTVQIYQALSYLLETPDVAVVIQAEHACVRLRGVQDPCSDTTTSYLGGSFRTPHVHQEFLALCAGFK